MIDKTIGIIGCGNMGEAILKGLSRVIEKSTRIVVSESDLARRDYIQTTYKMIVAPDNHYLLKYSDAVIVAIKPQDFDALLKDDICCDVSGSKLLISIAAGVTTKHIERIVGKDTRVIRAMPNMPARIGDGVTAICRGSSATAADIELATDIFRTVGLVVEVKEIMMDAVTAISGSGPAYLFYLIEAMVESARALGLDAKTSRELVEKTALGSVKLLISSKEEPAALRKRVTSKGGTTEAAIKVFESKKFRSIVKAAAKAACARSKALSKG